MTPEIKEATIGEYIIAEDLLNSPIKLRLTAVELKKDEVESQTGKLMDKVIFYFVNNKKQDKEIGVLAFDNLVRQMNALDPDIGDVLQLETLQIRKAKYLAWKVEIVKKSDGQTPAKEVETGEVEKEKLPPITEGAVNKNSDEEEIKIEDIPFS